MTRRCAMLWTVPLLLAASACAKQAATDDVVDHAKLSSELEARADEVEERADQAVLTAEREAETELASLKEETDSGAAAASDEATTTER